MKFTLITVNKGSTTKTVVEAPSSKAAMQIYNRRHSTYYDRLQRGLPGCVPNPDKREGR